MSPCRVVSAMGGRGHVCTSSFILTGTRNLIRTLYSRCPLDEGREYLLGVLFLVSFTPFWFSLLYTYIYYGILLLEVDVPGEERMKTFLERDNCSNWLTLFYFTPPWIEGIFRASFLCRMNAPKMQNALTSDILIF